MTKPRKVWKRPVTLSHLYREGHSNAKLPHFDQKSEKRKNSVLHLHFTCAILIFPHLIKPLRLRALSLQETSVTKISMMLNKEIVNQYTKLILTTFLR